jgi:hypothetical protein
MLLTAKVVRIVKLGEITFFFRLERMLYRKHQQKNSCLPSVANRSQLRTAFPNQIDQQSQPSMQASLKLRSTIWP